MNNRIVWVFREERSGSTWFTSKLCHHLNRQFYFFDGYQAHKNFKDREEYFLNRKQENEDYDRVLNTHNFFAMKSLGNYDNPVILRITRKDKVEQIISLYMTSMINLHNIHNNAELAKLPKLDKFIIPINKIEDYVNQFVSYEEHWQKYSLKYERVTVYYENLLDSYSSPLLNISNWSMKNLNDSPTLKLPYDKKTLVLNYNQIELYIKKYL